MPPEGATRVREEPRTTEKHLREDVPPMLDAFAKEYQELTFELLAPVGRQPVFMAMLEDLVGQSLQD